MSLALVETAQWALLAIIRHLDEGEPIDPELVVALHRVVEDAEKKLRSNS
jgi:hypothetical protein